ncbi:RNA-directed DNA polymerase, eukaryota [Tanacetum coccineum]
MVMGVWHGGDGWAVLGGIGWESGGLFGGFVRRRWLPHWFTFIWCAASEEGGDDRGILWRLIAEEEAIAQQVRARDFNHFITSAGLVEVQLEGYSYTWAHPSASKMSKLDRFLVSDGFLSLFPHTSAVCLDRHLSDHRPILLREFNTDYGATPFRLFHSWFDFQGFDDMITQTWNSINLNDSNAMVRFKKKLQALKKVIRLWIGNYKRNQMNRTTLGGVAYIAYKDMCLSPSYR